MFIKASRKVWKRRIRWPFMIIVFAACGIVAINFAAVRTNPIQKTVNKTEPPAIKLEKGIPDDFQPRDYLLDTSGFQFLVQSVSRLKPTTSLAEISEAWNGVAKREIKRIDQSLNQADTVSREQRFTLLRQKASLLNSEGEARKACQILEEARATIAGDDRLMRQSLYNVIFYQGVTALRRGENDNCIMCRGESSCILPISSSAVHAHPDGSRLAIKHFTEYLERFPDDLEVRWLLNIAYMTLGEYPTKVDPAFLISLDVFCKKEFDIGEFRDIGHIVGVNRFNQSGGAIMEDFDNDGLLDIVVTSIDPTCSMNLIHNTGDGTFEDITRKSELADQLGGLNCVQTDYNNDGKMDIFVIRGAWVAQPMRPSLLRQENNGTFTDVTLEAGLSNPVNSIAASWADYDNDGWLDLFICCERQESCLYRNLGNGAFEEVASKVGIFALSKDRCKGAAWIDYDNDGFPDLFQNFLSNKPSQLYHNNRDGTFSDVSRSQGITGPVMGFSCWAWDYDNDGWEDIFATCYNGETGDVVKGMLGQPHRSNSNRLYRNRNGKGFDDVTKEAKLDLYFAAMGSNFGDFDNDGFLDMYLGTGKPDLAALVPNRMFKNIGGKRFADITASSRTGNLQKGHGVACGDWDRDGNTDIFINMGGPVNGDKYHNILFQNPGHSNNWVTVSLVGEKTNRTAIGARIKIVTAGENSRTIHRSVSSGSSFGANPLQQTIGLSKADQIASLEIDWPTSGTKQVFRNLAVNQAIIIHEFADDYQILDWKPIPIPKPMQANPKMTEVK